MFLDESNGAFFALSVIDYELMVGWYTKHLGFRIETEDENTTRKAALLSRHKLLLEIARFPDARPLANLAEGIASHQIQVIFKMGFVVDDIERIFQSAQREELNIFFQIVETDTGMKIFGLRDPEGNLIQFFEMVDKDV